MNLTGGGWTAARALLASAAVVTAVGALLAGALAVWGARSGRIGWTLAVDGLLGALTPTLALAAVVTGLGAAVLALVATPRGAVAPAIVAAAVGAGALVSLAAWRSERTRQALVSPPVHDVATDWRDPLTPTAALLHRRGADALPIEAAPALSEGPRGGFLGRLVAEVNAATCPQARTLVLSQPPGAAYARLKAATLKAGLRLVTDDAAAGVLEAEATAPLAYGARADVLARVRPHGDGATVDLRSISRHGALDGGTNCRRVSELRAAIAAG